MQQLLSQYLTLFIASTLGFWTLSGTGAFDDNDPVALTALSEEADERIDVEDFDDVDAIVGHSISIVDARSLHLQLDPRHGSPSLAHAWHCCSRGPPLA